MNLAMLFFGHFKSPMRLYRLVGLSAACVAIVACARIASLGGTPPLFMPRVSFSADSTRTQQLAPGAAYHFVWSRSGPWAIHILDLDRTQCWTPIIVKGTNGAVGRTRT